MKTKLFSIPFFLIIAAWFLVSCQKELDGSSNGVIVVVDQKPRVGTIWTYRYYTYYSYGALATTKVILHKARNEEVIGGEKWLNVIDVDFDTTVYLLNVKTGGLYQYTNNNSYLLCKDPAVLNETYNTFNSGATEDFTVKGVNDTLPTGVGDVPANYYEGVKTGYLIDLVWYNKNAWIVRRYQYVKKPPPSTLYYRYSTMFIDNIVY